MGKCNARKKVEGWKRKCALGFHRKERKEKRKKDKIWNVEQEHERKGCALYRGRKKT